jgi:hypothetical protein
MAIRIQLRRDTAANWVTNNPTLREGELGIETDTLKIKIGNGSAWNSISNYANVVPADLNTTLGDYVVVSDIGAQGGVVGLNNSYNAIIPGSSLIIEGATDNAYETTLTVTDPTADRTITLPDATGTVALTSDITTAVDAITTDVIEEGSTNKYFTDERAQDAVAQALANGTHTNITVGYNDGSNAISLTGAVTYTDENAQDAVGNAVGTGLSYNDSTGAISVDTTTIQARVSGVSDTEIGYLDGVTSAIQTQINAKQDIVSGVSSTEIGYLDGVTSAIQTQIDAKAPINNPTFTGTVTLPGAPSTANEAATKAYVDNITAGLNFHAAVHAATTADLSATYNNGAGTLSASGTFPQIDGETISETQRVLVKSQSDAKQNGIYTLTDDGDPSGTWVLTRASDADNSPAGEIAYGDFVFVQTGSTNGGYGYTMTTTGTITLGTSNINWTQFNTGQAVVAGNGLSEPTAGTLAINTAITADLSTAQTLTNKTLTSPTITGTGAIAGTFTGNLTGDVTGNVSGNAGTVTNGVYTNAANTITAATSSTKPLVIKGAASQSANIQEWQNSSNTVVAQISPYGAFTGAEGSFTTSYNGTPSLTVNAVGTSQTADLQQWKNSSGSVLAKIDITGGLTASSITVGNVSNTEIGYLDGVTSAIQTQLDAKVAKSLVDAKGDLLVGTADNTVARIGIGTDGYLLTADSSTTEGLKWAAAPVSLPSQTGESGKYLTTDGSTASWANLVVPIKTGTASISLNTATVVDSATDYTISGIEYTLHIKQGSKIRTSKVLMNIDAVGSVDITEYAIVETNGTMSGVSVTGYHTGSVGQLKVAITDASSTNATVKFSKIEF